MKVRLVYVKEAHPDGWHWKIVAAVFDAEGEGLLGRFLDASGLEWKVEDEPT